MSTPKDIREGAETKEAAASSPDNYVGQIVKLIPAEIVGVYLGLTNLFIIKDEPWTQFIAQSIVFLVILGISPLYLKIVAGMTDQRQRVVSLISYIVWGISLGGPFAYLLRDSKISAATIGSALITLYTLIVPLIYNPKKLAGQ